MSSLQDVLDLVGSLDDAGGEDSPRERFRRHLVKTVTKVGLARDDIEVCLRTPGPQYNRALQDLINHVAHLLGFTVEFGRYQGVPGKIGYDGLWTLGDFTIVAEVKTTDAYTIKTATLLGYINELVSERRVTDRDHALGLYIVGRPDAELSQITNAIIAERNTHLLRIATVNSILSLAELKQNDDLSTAEALSLIRPSGVSISDVVALVSRIASRPPEADEETPQPARTPTADKAAPSAPVKTPPGAEPTERLHIMTPVADRADVDGERVVRRLLDNGWYVFRDRTPGRKSLKSGDQLCFYWSGVGVVAAAEVASVPERKPNPYTDEANQYPWQFRIRHKRYFFDRPVIIDAPLRARLDAFKGKDPNNPWSWFVLAARILTSHDFEILTQAQPNDQQGRGSA